MWVWKDDDKRITKKKENHDSRVELFNRSVSNRHWDNLSKEQDRNYLLINHYRRCNRQIIQEPERENQKKTEENKLPK